MARFISNAKLLSSVVAATRRGYAAAAASQGVASSGSASSAVRGGAMARKGAEETARSSPWVPDPKTGYYKPENCGNDIDVAELREMLLKSKISRH